MIKVVDLKYKIFLKLNR